MREPNDYMEEVRTACEKCRDAYEEKIDKLERENMGLQDQLTDAEARYATLVEVVGTRTGQAKPLEQVVGPDPRD